MTKQELWEFELEVGRMPNGPERFRLEDVIAMAKHGTPKRLEEVRELESEVEDLRDQNRSLEEKLQLSREALQGVGAR